MAFQPQPDPAAASPEAEARPGGLRTRLHGRFGPVTSALLLLLILAWLRPAAQGPVVSVLSGRLPAYVLSGRLFREQFDIIHAGCVLDQPTIGKWLFLFTFMAATCFPATAVVGWLGDRRRRPVRAVFAAGAVAQAGALLCMLSWPLCWLIQYMLSMGATPRRVAGLGYALAGIAIVLGFVIRAVREPRATASPAPEPVPAGDNTRSDG